MQIFKKQYEPGTKDGMQTMTTDLTVLQMTDSHTLGGGGGGKLCRVAMVRPNKDK